MKSPLPIILLLCALLPAIPGALQADQTIVIDGGAGGPRFDGIGAVSGGGATSVLLKDYPEPQRDQILDLLFKPLFGASISTLYVEVGGDGNSTQGSEPSHMHSKDDLNYHRGYEWWLMQAAKSRNPDISLDACAWSCPGWVGNGNFYSQDMCDYYAKWARGLKDVYGLQLNALGIRNESGVHEEFAKMLRRTLDENGLNQVILHGFDWCVNSDWDWTAHLRTDPELNDAVGILSNHVLGRVWEKDVDPTPKSIQALAAQLHKPIWDTEEHVYEDGFKCALDIVKSFNVNYLDDGATKIVNWYLEDSTYEIEPFGIKPGMLIAKTPWSGHYEVREALWGYAHYGQFSKIGWTYLNGACGKLIGGGTFVTLKSPQNDYSVIMETGGAKESQNVTFQLSGDLGDISQNKLCVWRSNSHEQFIQQADLTPEGGSYALTLDPDSIYSLSTTTGQQKGGFADIPPPQPFPFPYYETFEEYKDKAAWGYLPHYTADIASGFELADRPDGKGQCLKQVVAQKAQSWGAEWRPVTILGDAGWTDYEVSCDLLIGETGWAGLMGRVSKSNSQTDKAPVGYLVRLDADGTCTLSSTLGGKGEAPLGRSLGTGKSELGFSHGWHNLKLRMAGENLSVFLDGASVLEIQDKDCARGMVALVASSDNGIQTTACYDNLIIKPVGAGDPAPTRFDNILPMYPPPP